MQFLDCPICYNNINTWMITKCNHYFCCKCFELYDKERGQRNLLCPICRYILRTKGGSRWLEGEKHTSREISLSPVPEWIDLPPYDFANSRTRIFSNFSLNYNIIDLSSRASGISFSH